MASRRKRKEGRNKRELEEKELEGFKLLKPVSKLLAGLRDEGNPNRSLHFDHYVTLLLFYFFNPALTSLRGLQAATEFSRVRKKLGIPRSSLGSLSAAQHVFDHEQLAPILPDLLRQLPANKGDTRLSALNEVVTLADGSLFKALPRVAWALWLKDGTRAAKAHVQFEVLKGAPSRVDVTAANGSERAVFEQALEAGRLYVIDSGYAKLRLFQAVIDAGSNFVCRLPNGWSHEVLEERPLSDADRKARVVRDVVVKLGTAHSSKQLKQKVRIVEIEKVDEPSKRMRSERPVRETIVLVTDRMDLPADMVALLYSARWKIEIFFRWLKCTLGCRKLVAESENGAALQFYSALITCLLISLWVGKKPTKRTWEAICFYFMGLADAEDVVANVKRLRPHEVTS
jgi:Transposase DDE domain